MNKQTMGSKNNRKSKLEKEMENLSKQLKQKEIKPMEFAENFPVKIVRNSKANVVQAALAEYKKQFGAKEYKEMQKDIYARSEVVCLFVLNNLSNLRDGLEALKDSKGGMKAFNLLGRRVTYESIRVYPWLIEQFYRS
ncbi:hypothetical protein [Leptospira noguchii]|uniref:Uncharacterized protein n=1 Tax=Leptospira noguchii serovar Panama str. CZ214 TaxID=1001595 RepID=T0FHN5_9LEPT|nr:hypothetical protein [Leptospira noguchii]EQA72853.1 hypothetical protein LEP1GSC059_3389 [Leptospira noguchii serovar Panama str. CZ214]